MATFNDFYPYVMPNVQGCPTQIVKTALRCAINDFCERTLLWRHMFDPADVVAGQKDYAFVPPVGSVITKPTYVSVNGFILQPTNEEDLDRQVQSWRDSESSQPGLFYMDYNSNLILVPTPAADIVGGLTFETALKLDATSETLPDWLFQNWAEIIAHGALMRLHAMFGKVWADTQTVAYHKMKFREGVTFAKSRAMKSFVRQGKGVQPRYFW